MSKESNPEVPLMREFRNAVVTGDPGGIVHRAGRFQSPPTGGGKSENYHLAEAAAALASGWKAEEQIARFKRTYEAARMKPTPGISTGWMGSEQESRIYDGMHFCPWLYAHYKTRMKEAELWLKAWFAIAELSTTQSGRVLWVGQRGAIPGSGGHRFVDGVIDVARGGKIDRWRRGWRREDGTWPPDWDILEHLSSHVSSFYHAYIDGRSEEDLLGYIAHFTYRVPRNWIHDGQGRAVACWCEYTVNGNTPPMMGAVVLEDGTIKWLPHNGGTERIRSKNDDARCMLDRDEMSLIYSAKFSKPRNMRVPILAQPPLKWTRVDTDGGHKEQWLGASGPSPEPSTIPPVHVPQHGGRVRLVIDLVGSGTKWEATVVSAEER